jgi:exodeoxyribonuclease III
MLEIEALGYHVETHGQKGFNGVAILSRLRFDEVTRGLPGDDADEQARFIEGVFSVDGGVLRVVSAYMPNGNPIGTEKFTYKLAWMERLQAWTEGPAQARGAAGAGRRLQHHPAADRRQEHPDWLGDALYQPQSRAALRRLEALGMTECVRSVTDEAETYTFWDYQGGAWQKNNGIRIDHILLSPEAADRFAAASIDKRVRAWEKPSDHVPVIAELRFSRPALTRK